MNSKHPWSQGGRTPGRFWLAVLSLGLLLASGTAGVRAGAGEGTPAGGMTPVLASLHPPKSPASRPHETVTLAPFYLLREEDSRVWVERYLVTLEVNLLEPQKVDPTAAGLRAVVYELLHSETHMDELSAKAQAALNNFLGGRVVAAVKVSRSALLLP